MIKNFISDISVPLDTLPYIRMDIIKFYFVLEADKVQVAQAFKSLKRKTSKKIFDHSFQNEIILPGGAKWCPNLEYAIVRKPIPLRMPYQFLY